MASIKGIICKLFGHKLVICSNKKINDITYLQEVKCTICGKIYKRYSYDKKQWRFKYNRRRIARIFKVYGKIWKVKRKQYLIYNI